MLITSFYELTHILCIFFFYKTKKELILFFLIYKLKINSKIKKKL